MAADRDPLAGQIRRLIERAASDAPDADSVHLHRTATLVPLDSRAPTRTRWLFPAAALVVVSLGAAAAWVALANRRDDTPTLVESTSTSITAAPATTSPATTVPDTTVVPTTVPDAGVVIVPDATAAQPLARDILWVAGVGSGPDEIGLEQDGCRACAGPWAPLVLADGTIVIADDVNARWVVVQNGEATDTPLAAGDAFAGQPVLGPDQEVYAPLLRTSGTATSIVVATLDPFALDTPFDEVPLDGAAPYVALSIDDDRLVDSSGTTVTTFAVSAGPASVSRRDDIVQVTAFGTTTSWQLPATWQGATQVLGVLPDGTVVLRGPELARLAPDRTVATGTMDGVNMSQNGSVTLTDQGIVQLERNGADGHWQVVRYALPHLPGADAPACTAADVTAHLGASEGAMGTQYVPLVFANSSDHTCRLLDTPSLVLLDDTGNPMPDDGAGIGTASPVGPLLDGVVYPGATASAVLSWSLMCDAGQGGGNAPVSTIRIGLADGSTLDVATDDTGVDASCGVAIGPFGRTAPD